MRTATLTDEALAALSSDHDYDESWIRLKADSIPSLSSSSEEVITRIPRYIQSKATLEFLGFTNIAASLIFERYEQASVVFPQSEFFDFVKGFIKSVGSAQEDNDNWEGVLTRMGIKEEIKNRMLNSQFDRIRLSESAQFWVTQMVETKFMFVTRLLTVTLGIQPKASHMVTLDSRIEKDSTSKPKGASKSTQKSNNPKAPILSTGTEDREVHDNEVDLLKGGTEERLIRAFFEPDEPEVEANRLERILSDLFSDWSPTSNDLYFTKQKELAYDYAVWAREFLFDTGTYCNVGILHMVTPKELLQEAHQLFGDEWSEYTMRSRLRSIIPNHLSYLNTTPMLVGPVALLGSDQVRRLVGPDRDFKKVKPYRMPDGSSASQWCFKGAEIIQKLNENTRLWFERIQIPEPK